jgi:hypothetical protein
VASLIGLALALARELSGEARLERAVLAAAACKHDQPDQNGGATEQAPADRTRAYVKMTEERFNDIRRCC